MTSTPDPLINLMSGEFFANDPYPAFAWMRENAPVYHDEPNNLWGVSRYHDVKAASVDTETYSNAGGVRPKFPPLPMMIDFDAPEHVRRRRLVSSGFTPARVRQMTDHIRAICDEVIDGVCQQGACDFVKDIAAPLPLIAIGDMLGVAPEDRDDLLRWSEVMLMSQSGGDQADLEAAMHAFMEYTEYLGPVIEDRKKSKTTDDLIGILCQAEIEGDQLDHDSLVHETLLILVGGDETTRHVLSGGMLALLEHPDQHNELRNDPANHIGPAVEEMLRWVTPIKNMVRTATRDVELNGSHIQQGDELLLLYPSANRDRDVFDNPDRFDITRDPNPHVAFGFGAHFCLGNQLARLELKVMTERLGERLPDLALTGEITSGRDLPRRRANFITGLEAMPVTFTPTAPIGRP